MTHRLQEGFIGAAVMPDFHRLKMSIIQVGKQEDTCQYAWTCSKYIVQDPEIFLSNIFVFGDQ